MDFSFIESLQSASERLPTTSVIVMPGDGTLEWVGLVVSGTLGLLTLLLLRHQAKQLRLHGTTLRDQLDAMEDQAAATKATVAAMGSRESLELRAYLTIEFATPQVHLGTDTIQWDFAVRNVGATLARDVTIWFDAPAIGPNDASIPGAASRLRGSSSGEALGAIPPGGVRERSGFYEHFALVNECSSDPANGRRPFLLGSLQYWDVYGQEHFTHFAAFLIWLDSTYAWHCHVLGAEGNSAD